MAKIKLTLEVDIDGLKDSEVSTMLREALEDFVLARDLGSWSELYGVETYVRRRYGNMLNSKKFSAKIAEVNRQIAIARAMSHNLKISLP